MPNNPASILYRCVSLLHYYFIYCTHFYYPFVYMCMSFCIILYLLNLIQNILPVVYLYIYSVMLRRVSQYNGLSRSCVTSSPVMWSETVGLRTKIISLGLAGLVLCCETRSCHTRRHSDLEGHCDISSTIYSLSILCLGPSTSLLWRSE